MTTTNLLPQELEESRVFWDSDQGLAELLIRKYGDVLMHCPELGGWFAWSGSKWTKNSVDMKELAKNVGKELLVEAVEALQDTSRDELIQRARNALKEHRTEVMIRNTETDSRIHADSKLFDAKPKLFNTLSGTIDLQTGNHRNHDRNDVITKLANVAYDAKAKAQKWERFLARVLPDENIRRYVQKIAGYSLSGEMSGQEFYIHHGSGSNGKSTFFDTLLTIMDEYAGTFNINALMMAKEMGGDKPNSDVVSLRGKRLAVTSESESGQHLRESLIKGLTGDKYITARDLHKPKITFERTFKIHMHVNHKPIISGTGTAIWRRVRLIPWTVTIPDDEKNPDLVEELLKESPGILNWLLKGYEMYKQEGLKPPKAIEDETDKYRESMDRIGNFLREECFINSEIDLEANTKYWTTKNDLYIKYSQWCDLNNMNPLASNKFGEQIKERFPESEATKRVGGKRAKIWKGIGILADQ